VSPAALGSGYMVFFLYSTLIGVFAIALTFAVARRTTAQDAAQGAPLDDNA
jgi:PAT family beta-lactamase induction signal transducer AmpG